MAGARYTANNLTQQTREFLAQERGSKTKEVSTDYRVKQQDGAIIVDTSAGSVTLTLLKAKSNDGLEHKIVVQGSNPVLFKSDVGDDVNFTVEGNKTSTIKSLGTKWQPF
jgi:ferric-dicitrate binding protein FerR (iron transport regulator)